MKSLLDAAVTFRDPDILARVTKADVARVLAGLGWTHWATHVPRGFTVEVWRFGPEDKPIEDCDEVTIPDDRHEDRPARYGEIVQRLSEVHGIPPLRVVQRLLPGCPVV